MHGVQGHFKEMCHAWIWSPWSHYLLAMRPEARNLHELIQTDESHWTPEAHVNLCTGTDP